MLQIKTPPSQGQKRYNQKQQQASDAAKSSPCRTSFRTRATNRFNTLHRTVRCSMLAEPLTRIEVAAVSVVEVL
jgi:hypothetical protein